MTLRVALLVVLVLSPAPRAGAEEAPPPPSLRDVSRLDGQVGERMHGRLALNVVAGHGNAQANLAAIAHGPASQSDASVTQHVAPSTGVAARDALAVIDGRVLAGAQGVASVNQVAGSGNAQLNALAILAGGGASTHGAQTLDPAVLATVAVDPVPAGTPSAVDPAPLREARIDGGAFQGPQGVLQINQTAGVGNASTNAIVLHIPGGAP